MSWFSDTVSSPSKTLTAIGTGGLSTAWDNLVPHQPGAPNLPQAPTLQAPQLPNYPMMTPEMQALLKQQQGALTGTQGAVSNYGANPYLQQSQQADTQALTNYQNALTGNIAPNQMIAQQKARDWAQTVQQAAQQGIRLSGDSPESAVSQSTAGNQIIQDFTKRYGALEQNYNLGQQQVGMAAQAQGLGQVNQQYQNTLGGYGQIANQSQQLYQPYQQQNLGQFGVQTQQALTNADISNQNSMNQYNQQLQQIALNYQNQLSRYQNQMGLVSGALGLAGTIGGAVVGGPAGAMIGSQIGGQAGSMFGGNRGGGGAGGMSINPGSYVSQYQPSGTMQAQVMPQGYQPYQPMGLQGPYAYGRAN